MHSEFHPYKEGEPMYITIRRARGLMPPVWPGVLAVISMVFLASIILGSLINYFQ